MTVSYSQAAYTYRLCAIVRLLFRWRGSVYKLIFLELLIYCAMHSSVSVLYMTVITAENGTVKDQFDRLNTFTRKIVDNAPLTFVLGMYVHIIMGRWFQYFLAIPWAIKLAILITTYIRGQDDEGRKIRRSVMRYVILAFVLASRRISVQIRRRFPHTCDLVQLGLLTKPEYEMLKQYRRAKFSKSDDGDEDEFELSKQAPQYGTSTNKNQVNGINDSNSFQTDSAADSAPASSIQMNVVADYDDDVIGRVVDEDVTDDDDAADAYATFFVPCVWAANVVHAAYKKRRILSQFGRSDIISEIDSIRNGLQKMFNYDCVPLPLLYSQVVWIAVYTYFLFQLAAGLPVDREVRKEGFVDIFQVPVPIYIYLQFFIYVGLLKVAESCLNPMGLDDDDFEMNEILDFQLEVGLLMVDALHDDLPCGNRMADLEDPHDGRIRVDLPHTVASEQRHRKLRYSAVAPYMGSASIMALNELGRTVRKQSSSSRGPQDEIGSRAALNMRRSFRRNPSTTASGFDLRQLRIREGEASPLFGIANLQTDSELGLDTTNDEDRNAKKHEQRKSALDKWTMRMQGSTSSYGLAQRARGTLESVGEAPPPPGELQPLNTGSSDLKPPETFTATSASQILHPSASTYIASDLTPRCVDDEDTISNDDDYFWLLPFRETDPKDVEREVKPNFDQ